MNEVVEEYLRRIHQAGGLPTEQAIDTTDALPRSRALAPSIASRAARFRSRPISQRRSRRLGEM